MSCAFNRSSSNGVCSGCGPSSNVNVTARLSLGPDTMNNRRGSALAIPRLTSCRTPRDAANDEREESDGREEPETEGIPVAHGTAPTIGMHHRHALYLP